VKVVDVYGNESTVSVQALSDAAAFEEQLKVSLGEACLPYWDQAACKGHFCIELESLPSVMTRSPDLAAWQDVVKQIGAASDFREEPFFYSVRRLYKLGSDQEASLSKGKYVVAANSSYRLEIAHFSPDSDTSRRDGGGADVSSIAVTVGGRGLQVLGGSRIVVDSPYDLNEVGFRTHGESRRLHALISVSRITKESAEGSTGMADKLDFEIPIEINWEWAKTIGLATLIGLFLAAQQAVPLLKANQLDVTSALVLSVLGVLIGFMVVLVLRRPHSIRRVSYEVAACE
jgi:hypothetical protein